MLTLNMRIVDGLSYAFAFGEIGSNCIGTSKNIVIFMNRRL